MPLIKIRSMDGTEIFESPGEIQMAMRDGQPYGCLRIDREGQTRTIDLTRLLQSVPSTWTAHYEEPGLEWTVDPDPIRVPSPPRVICWELKLDVVRGAALALKDHIRDGAAMWGVSAREDEPFTSGMTRAAMQNLRMQNADRVAAEAADIYTQYIQGRIRDEYRALRVTEEQAAAFQRNEELIEQTRSEFPHDPLGYGRFHPKGPSRWTPPDDPDEKVGRCPA